MSEKKRREQRSTSAERFEESGRYAHTAVESSLTFLKSFLESLDARDVKSRALRVLFETMLTDPMGRRNIQELCRKATRADMKDTNLSGANRKQTRGKKEQAVEAALREVDCWPDRKGRPISKIVKTIRPAVVRHYTKDDKYGLEKMVRRLYARTKP